MGSLRLFIAKVPMGDISPGMGRNLPSTSEHLGAVGEQSALKMMLMKTRMGLFTQSMGTPPIQCQHVRAAGI